MSSENYRSEFIYDVFKDFVDPSWSVLEVGSGTGRHVKYLNERGYNVVGIDKLDGTAIEDVPETKYDVIYTMSTLFLIPPENDWVFAKIARMARKYIITVEGEVGQQRAKDSLYGRIYSDVFSPFGFKQIASQSGVFNEYGVLRVMKHE